MANLSRFKTDSRAIRTGEWVVVDRDEYGDLEILTRGFTDEYFDAQARRQKVAARGLGGDTEKLPSSVKRGINIECIIEHMILDVRNLRDDENGGREISIEEFRELLRNPDYSRLIVACFQAANKVGQLQAADLEAALGNFEPPSNTSAPGDALPPS